MIAATRTNHRAGQLKGDFFGHDPEIAFYVLMFHIKGFTSFLLANRNIFAIGSTPIEQIIPHGQESMVLNPKFKAQSQEQAPTSLNGLGIKAQGTWGLLGQATMPKKSQ